MKHQKPTVNHVPRDSLWEIFMPSDNASVLHIFAPPIDHGRSSNFCKFRV